ncbi:PREDICTED: 26S protease regulatory subunit 8 homolog B-like [Camelina sativa]|uniref:ubiquitinyl hydrolase 1 n=1 Tax=Camelina sativa TaxID=90675 RepID=A0ABM1RE62_CAMSA|nr:PREDICTED: 26S protease regulatory subunit 8 homolog B-like [Camelina sativa]
MSLLHKFLHPVKIVSGSAATKEEVVIHNIRLPKHSTVGDVINELKTKVELSHPDAELRLLEVFYHKIYKIFPSTERVENINDQYWTLRAEEVLMATNRIDILDQALLRPGSIDRKIESPNPNGESRFDILKIHSRKMNLMRGIELKKMAEKMNGALGAELKAVCTEAGMFALRERRVHVTQEDFEMAVAKVIEGRHREEHVSA